MYYTMIGFMESLTHLCNWPILSLQHMVQVDGISIISDRGTTCSHSLDIRTANYFPFVTPCSH